MKRVGENRRVFGEGRFRWRRPCLLPWAIEPEALGSAWWCPCWMLLCRDRPIRTTPVRHPHVPALLEAWRFVVSMNWGSDGEGGCCPVGLDCFRGSMAVRLGLGGAAPNRCTTRQQSYLFRPRWRWYVAWDVTRVLLAMACLNSTPKQDVGGGVGVVSLPEGVCFLLSSLSRMTPASTSMSRVAIGQVRVLAGLVWTCDGLLSQIEAATCHK